MGSLGGVCVDVFFVRVKPGNGFVGPCGGSDGCPSDPEGEGGGEGEGEGVGEGEGEGEGEG